MENIFFNDFKTHLNNLLTDRNIRYNDEVFLGYFYDDCKTLKTNADTDNYLKKTHEIIETLKELKKQMDDPPAWGTSHIEGILWDKRHELKKMQIHGYYMRTDLYVLHLFFMLQEIISETGGMSIIAFMLKMLGNRFQQLSTKCHTDIKINIIGKKYYTEIKGDKKLLIGSDKDNKESKQNIELFYNVLLKKIETECQDFFLITLGISRDEDKDDHQNVILVKISPTKIVLSHYEPHGIRVGKTHVLSKIVKLLAKIIGKKTGKKVIINPGSCHTGLQTHTVKYDKGFCQIFSIFWLYANLYISMLSDEYYTRYPSRKKESYSRERNLQKIETYYLTLPSALVYSIILGFAVRLIFSYITNANLKPNDIIKLLNKKIMCQEMLDHKDELIKKDVEFITPENINQYRFKKDEYADTVLERKIYEQVKKL